MQQQPQPHTLHSRLGGHAADRHNPVARWWAGRRSSPRFSVACGHQQQQHETRPSASISPSSPSSPSLSSLSSLASPSVVVGLKTRPMIAAFAVAESVDPHRWLGNGNGSDGGNGSDSTEVPIAGPGNAVVAPPRARASATATSSVTGATAGAAGRSDAGASSASPARTAAHILSGAGSGAVAALVTTPLDVIKTRMQVSSQTRGLRATFLQIVRTEGALKLYSGLSPTLMGLLPNWAIYFTTYETLKHPVANMLGTSVLSPMVHASSAMLAGASCALATNPLWVVKTRMMTQNSASHHQYNGLLHAFQTIARTEGVRGFYKGLVPSLLGVVHVGIQFPLYERLKGYFLAQNPDHPLGPVQLMTSAALSKIVASVIWYPHEVVRARLQNQSQSPPKYHGVIHTVRLTVQESGVRALYAGLFTNLLRVVPAGAITFTTYEMFNRMLLQVLEGSP
ncbi:substrate carrier family protein [Capsaspora owczarzaki ATCC 30864]|uniref:Substrate carrier family protein n=1 Tax=Capsaspora owczarzaki (strain ATCC 30864) TaxID=595528 RepID=A0A0D2UQK3_CAPO3|nr:substrate carrier family protein [Capsaspora owczarzaki ATCC 30864]KJE97291.1 substrate carrier family protein [Capsaspora owczarzaki ATCC 30864]|eukprot:XP_004343599.2 substrate carrier family protein [Capsaspora owczarzaki ATCC 30864]